MRKLLFFLILVPVLASAQTAFDGTWKISFSSADFSDKPDTVTLVNGDYACSTCDPSVSLRADGIDHKLRNSKDKDSETLAITLVDDRTIKTTRKLNGRVTKETRETVSDDGKSLVIEATIYPATGDPVPVNTYRTRVANGPTGSHAISGTWRTVKVEDYFVYVIRTSTRDGQSMAASTGETYEAKFDGRDYPYKGGPSANSVSLHRINDNTIVETYKENGTPVRTAESTVHGNTITVISTDLKTGSILSFTAEKQTDPTKLKMAQSMMPKNQ